MAMVLASGSVPSQALWPLMAALGFGVGTAGPGRDLLVRRAATARFGKTSFGRVYGFVYAGLDSGLAMSPVLFGPLLDAGRLTLRHAVGVLHEVFPIPADKLLVPGAHREVEFRGRGPYEQAIVERQFDAELAASFRDIGDS